MKNILIILFALAALSITSCKKNDCGPNEHYGTRYDTYGNAFKDCIPNDEPTPTCTTCGGTTPTPSPWGTVSGTYTGFIYNAPESGVKAYKRNADGTLVYVTTDNGNYVTSPTIWGAWVFDNTGTQSVSALLNNGTDNPGTNQKICDWLAGNSNHYVQVTFTENANGDAFGEMQDGTLMYYKITSIAYLSR